VVIAFLAHQHLIRVSLEKSKNFIVHLVLSQLASHKLEGL
jgi:hypothetical protein